MAATIRLGLIVLAGCAPQVLWSGSNPDRLVQAQVMARGDSQWVRAAGRDEPRYRAIGVGGVVFSGDGSRTAYAAERAGRWFMVLDGRPLGPWDGVAEPTFSRAGDRFAFLAQTGSLWQVVVDGVASPVAGSVKTDTLRFSPDGRHVGWVATEDARCSRIVLDRILGTCREGIVSFRLTNAGPVAVVQDGHSVALLQGNVLGPARDAISDWAISDDGRHVAYVARAGRQWEVLLDGRRLCIAPRIRDLVFGDDGNQLAFALVDPPRARIILGDASGPSFLLVGPPLLAQHASRLVYTAEDEGGAWVIADGVRRGPFGAVLELELSPDGAHLAYVVRSQGRVRVVHDATERDLDAVVPGTFVLSDDGAHWAVVAADAKSRALWISVDGRQALPVSQSDVFGDERSLRPWIRRQMAASLAGGAPR
jgi:hypothetical protein